MNHRRAIEAVQKNSGVPECSDRALGEAKAAGLIKFCAWPSGHWQVTTKGGQYMANVIDGDADQ